MFTRLNFFSSSRLHETNVCVCAELMIWLDFIHAIHCTQKIKYFQFLHIRFSIRFEISFFFLFFLAFVHISCTPLNAHWTLIWIILAENVKSIDLQKNPIGKICHNDFVNSRRHTWSTMATIQKKKNGSNKYKSTSGVMMMNGFRLEDGLTHTIRIFTKNLIEQARPKQGTNLKMVSPLVYIPNSMVAVVGLPLPHGRHYGRLPFTVYR